MIDRAQYVPGSADLAKIARKNGEKWTLVLERELRHAPDKVWKALTDPSELHEWAPFDADTSMDKVGASVNITWVGTPAPVEVKVTRADAPKVLEYSTGENEIRWELEPIPNGTRLTLYAVIERPYVSMGAAGWHIAFDVLERLLNGNPLNRISGADAMKFEGWQRLNAEYAQQFGVELPKWGG